jgi:predicted negative regulator of RcsB-dependent stress response
MAYDLEEQEQIAQLKSWWKDNGSLVIALLVAAAIGAAGWQGWRIWHANQAREAAALYDGLVKAMQANDAKALRDASGTLVESYPRTLYASMGALAAARFHFERGELKDARAQLQWVTERSSSEELKDLARLRLAGVLLDDKAYDEALQLLAAKHAEAMAAQYAALKGDILVAKNQPADAKAAYKLAIEKAGQRENALRASVQLRLDALGG